MLGEDFVSLFDFLDAGIAPFDVDTMDGGATAELIAHELDDETACHSAEYDSRVEDRD